MDSARERWLRAVQAAKDLDERWWRWFNVSSSTTPPSVLRNRIKDACWKVYAREINKR